VPDPCKLLNNYLRVASPCFIQL